MPGYVSPTFPLYKAWGPHARYRFYGELGNKKRIIQDWIVDGYKMEKFPKPDMILAGVLAQTSLRMIIQMRRGQSENDYGFRNTYICIRDGLLWLLLLLISAGVAFLTAKECKEVKNKFTHGIIAFSASFLLNFCGDCDFNLGYLAVFCTAHDTYENDASEFTSRFRFKMIYRIFSFVILAPAIIGILAHYLKKPTTPRPQAFDSKLRLPDPEILLLGVCAQFTIWHIIALASDGYYYYDYYDHGYYHGTFICGTKGIGIWVQLLILSSFLALISFIKRKFIMTCSSKKALLESLATFLSTLLIHLLQGEGGELAFICPDPPVIKSYRMYGNATLVLNAILAFGIAMHFLSIPLPPALPSQPEMELPLLEPQNESAAVAPAEAEDAARSEEVTEDGTTRK